MKTTEWLIVDTETDGLLDPIHVVEIAAQRMRGWEPVGEKFRVLLNHNVPIPPAAVAIHGYTQEFLRQNGEEPLQAHARFRDFAGGLPVVAHNLSFDWNRALYPEWIRLGLSPAGQRGFCSLMLSRRVVDETRSYSLDALRQTFGIDGSNAHRAFGDVDTMVTLFGRVFQPRLESAGIVSFSELTEFAGKTPVARCLAALKARAAGSSPTPPAAPLDSWYFIDSHDQTHGPLPAREILGFTGGQPCWVWQEGLPDWVSSERCEAFLCVLRTPPPLPVPRKTTRKRAGVRSTSELLGICRGIIADGIVTTEEVIFLSKWLEQAGVMTEWPGTEIAETVERIMADGVVTSQERSELQSLLQRVDQASKEGAKPKGKTTPKTSTPQSPAPLVAQPPTATEFKLACTCGQRIVVDAVAAGQQVNCPACGAAMRVPSAEPVPTVVSVIPQSVDETQIASHPFTIIQLTQGTLEWLQWRNQGIGASDAPTIMGENPWKTAADLLREKRGHARQSEPNAAMARGTALEPEARQAYISRTGKRVQPACLQSTTHGWLRASVDGITPTLEAVVEIKCGDSVYRKTAVSGRVPDYYYGQLQHILAVTGLSLIDFWCYLPGCRELLISVERDKRYIARLLEAEYQFWTKVLAARH